MLHKLLTVAIVACVSTIATSQADAQLVPRVVYYGGAQPTYVQPATYVQPTVVYRPPVATFVQPALQAVYAPRAAYYVPQQVVVARPVAPVAVVAPAPVVTRRYRPILGGTVTRQWYP